MKAYHKSCGSTNLGKQSLTISRGRYTRKVDIDICRDCKKIIESDEVIRPDRRMFHFHMDKRSLQ